MYDRETFLKEFESGLLLTAYSTAPLRFASWIGFSLTLFGVAILVHVLYVSLLYGSPLGFPFPASIIAIFSGTQLFALGIFGEYLARIFNRSVDRPAYVIRKTTGGEAAREEVQRHAAP
jgi:undecaprenyl-phosphate 4-deoxy-4-formamido-L-arabinose transferase